MERQHPLAICAVGILSLALAGCPEAGPAAPPPTANPNPVGNTPFAAVSRTKIKADFTAITRSAEAYKAAEGSWPASVDVLVQADFLKLANSKDPWERPYVLEPQGISIKVLSYGSDGAPGGQDADTDWDSESSALGVSSS